MSVPAPGFDTWLRTTKQDYYNITIEARDAPELIWNCPISPKMKAAYPYQIQWGDKVALRDVLVSVYLYSM